MCDQCEWVGCQSEQNAPDEWQQVVSKTSGKIYWYNVRSGATQWQPPATATAASAADGRAARQSTSGKASFSSQTFFPPVVPLLCVRVCSQKLSEFFLRKKEACRRCQRSVLKAGVLSLRSES